MFVEHVKLLERHVRGPGSFPRVSLHSFLLILAFLVSGTPNDGFLLNILKTHSKRRYKICIYLGHSRGTLVVSKLQGLQCHFSENFRCNL